jgi:hypothetical protein
MCSERALYANPKIAQAGCVRPAPRLSQIRPQRFSIDLFSTARRPASPLPITVTVRVERMANGCK